MALSCQSCMEAGADLGAGTSLRQGSSVIYETCIPAPLKADIDNSGENIVI